MRLSIAEIASCLGVPGTRGDALAKGVSIDSRRTAPGDLFVCLPGERVDGHDYAKKAEEAGAVAVLASRCIPALGVPQLIVENTETALGRLAAHWRRLSRATVICLTGTAGKTTLKSALAAIMTEAGKTAFTEGNHNNQIGLPLTILNTDGDEDFWVLEAGISHAGDMEYLGEIARPDIAVILNCGPGHTAGLGARSVAWHKTRLLRYLAQAGRAIVSADYPELADEAKALGISPVLFSAQGRHARFELESQEAGHYVINMPGGREEFAASFTATFGGEIVTAAVATASVAGATPEQMRAGFGRIDPPGQRYAHIRLGNYLLIDDTYNANPLSMERNLESAKKEAKSLGLPLIVVLGEMAELGEEAEECHRELGRKLAALNPATVFWKGKWAEELESALQGERTGMAGPNRFIRVQTPQQFLDAWQRHGSRMPDKGVVLFKGSRSNRMEEYLAALKGHLSEEGAKSVL